MFSSCLIHQSIIVGRLLYEFTFLPRMILNVAWYISQRHCKCRASEYSKNRAICVHNLVRKVTIQRVPLSQSRVDLLLLKAEGCLRQGSCRFISSAMVARPFRVLRRRAAVLKFNKGTTVPTPEEDLRDVLLSHSSEIQCSSLWKGREFLVL